MSSVFTNIKYLWYMYLFCLEFFNKQIPLSEHIHYCFHLSIVWSLNESHLCVQTQLCLQSRFKNVFPFDGCLRAFLFLKKTRLPANKYVLCVCSRSGAMLGIVSFKNFIMGNYKHIQEQREKYNETTCTFWEALT